MGYDDAYRLRDRQDDDDDDATRWEALADMGAPCIVGKTVAVGTYPTTASAYFWVTLHDVTGAESEGGAGAVSPTGGGRFLALNLGSAIPPAGSTVICTYVPYRYVFRWDG